MAGLVPTSTISPAIPAEFTNSSQDLRNQFGAAIYDINLIFSFLGVVPVLFVPQLLINGSSAGITYAQAPQGIAIVRYNTALIQINMVLENLPAATGAPVTVSGLPVLGAGVAPQPLLAGACAGFGTGTGISALLLSETISLYSGPPGGLNPLMTDRNVQASGMLSLQGDVIIETPSQYAQWDIGTWNNGQFAP